MIEGNRGFTKLFSVLMLWTALTAYAGQAQAQTVTITSEFLDRAQYDASARTLTIWFDDGSRYRYTAVPQSVFDALRTAKNPGSFFNKSIRDSFKYSQLAKPAPVPAANTAKPAERKPAVPPAATKPSATRPGAAKPNAAPTASSAGFPCPAITSMPKQTVKSEALDEVSYDATTRCLVLYFDSRQVYRYADVPANVYQQLIKTGPDPGIYFNKSVRNKFKFQRVK